MKFEQFPIARAIKTNISKLGYKKPTDIQYKTIPHILRKEDVLAIAQTGTGKTAAFAIPILHLLQAGKTQGRKDGVKCIVMAPTHELALQITNVFNTLGRNLDISTLCLYGGVDQEPQIEQLSQGVDIVVATPGRMFDLASQKHLNLQRIQILVLDEADHMLDLGFIKDIKDLIRMLPRRRQTLFFSATLNDKIKRLAYSIVSNPIRIQVSPKNPVAKNIEHAVSYVEMDDKRFFLEYLIKNNPEKKILVFVRTKVRAERVKNAMQRVDILSETIHSDKDQTERELTMSKFRTGRIKVLIATDVSARGIDIPNVEYVVNYDLPDSAENYVHRVGRTGRGRNKGNAISFCSEQEKEILADIENNLDKPIKRLEITKGDYSDIVDFSEDKTYDWKSLMNETNKDSGFKKRKKRKK